MLNLIRRYPAATAYLTFIAIAMVLSILVGCSSNQYPGPSTGPDSDACAEATEALNAYDTDPSTPDNIEPTIEDMAEFNEAYDTAMQACGMSTTTTGTQPPDVP